MAAGLPAPRVPAVHVGDKEEQLQQQAGIQLNLKENHRKQRDVNQTKQVVDNFFLTGEPDTQQAGQRTDRLNP
ncbi:hypothetical protein E05_08400 [Plautia stali symbiont]|nr:hypothetical protein E05_08400 [Plautia stali symbiont]